MRRIAVTQRNIDDGGRAASCRLSMECNCPIAVAVAEAGFCNPRVTMNTFTAGPALAAAVENRRRYRLPPEATTFIEHFDDSRHVEPFTFDVDDEDYTELLHEGAPA